MDSSKVDSSGIYHEDEDSDGNSQNQNRQNRPQRFRTFALILYPDCNHHMMVFKYIQKHDVLFTYMYIMHDRDVLDESDIDDAIRRWESLPDHEKALEPCPQIGDRKKPHYHMLVTVKEPYTLPGLKKLLGMDFVYIVANRASYALYMIHDTSDSWHKTPYDVDELHGSDKLKCFVQNKNANFVQLREMSQFITQKGATLSDLVEIVSENPDYHDSFLEHQYILKAICDERDRALDREYRRHNPLDIGSHDLSALWELVEIFKAALPPKKEV